MDIWFDSDLGDTCNNKAAMAVRWGSRLADLLGRRLAELSSLATLEDLKHLPGRPRIVRTDGLVFTIEYEMAISIECRPADPEGLPLKAWGGDKADVYSLLIERIEHEGRSTE